MKIAVYQFGVSGNIQENFKTIKNAVENAAGQNAELIAFPECALSGYPHRDYPDAKNLDFDIITEKINELKDLSDSLNIGIIVGTAFKDDKVYNRAYFIKPKKPLQWYDKRALYGWDEDNFSKGMGNGIFDFRGHSIGIRICYEVRFPEYFRELYVDKTDINFVLMNDVSDKDNTHRYRLIKSHLLTRAVENVTPLVSVDSIKPYQTAPSCVVDASGNVLAQCKRNQEGMLVFDIEKKDMTFGEAGRKQHSDALLGI